MHQDLISTRTIHTPYILYPPIILHSEWWHWLSRLVRVCGNDSLLKHIVLSSLIISKGWRWRKLARWLSTSCVPKEEGGFWKYFKGPWSVIHLMSCRNLCRLYIYLAFTYSIGPSSLVWSELGPAQPFPPMRMLEVQSLGTLSLMCEVALKERETKLSIGSRFS